MCCRGRSSNAGQMPAISLAIFSVVAFVLQPAAAEAEAKLSSVMEETLAAVRTCMERSPAPWPQEWQREYVDTIRKAIDARQGAPQCARRLEILCEGFEPYWAGVLKDSKERFHFEVRRAQIRWYGESLMDANLPEEEETSRLRRQYEDFLNYAATGLLVQFPFLDPNVVQEAKADRLADCYRNINAPLLPIFQHLFSESQVEQIKERWHDRRYARIDLWQQFARNPTVSTQNQEKMHVKLHPDYLLTQRTLDLLDADIWAVVAPPPEYFQSAVTNALNILEQRHLTMSKAYRQEMRMSMADIQTEYLSFLLATLLETAVCKQSTDIEGVIRSPDESCPLKGSDPNDVGRLLPTE